MNDSTTPTATRLASDHDDANDVTIDVAIPQPRGQGAHPVKVVLRTLAAALCDQPVPTSLVSSEERQRLVTIYDEQLAAAWRQLRSRHATALLAAHKLHEATVQAATWVHELLEPCGPDRQGIEPARQALIATITRRLVVDGLAFASLAVDTCRQAVVRAQAGA